MDADYQSFARSTRPLPSLTSDYITPIRERKTSDRQATIVDNRSTRPNRPFSTSSVPMQCDSLGPKQSNRPDRPIRETFTNQIDTNTAWVKELFDRTSAIEGYAPACLGRPLSTNCAAVKFSLVEEESIYEDLGQYENLRDEPQYYIDSVSAVSVTSQPVVANSHAFPPPPPLAPPSTAATPIAPPPPPPPGQGRPLAAVPPPPQLNEPVSSPTTMAQQGVSEETENSESE